MRGLRGRGGTSCHRSRAAAELEYERNHRHDTVKHIDEVSQYKNDYIVVAKRIQRMYI